MHPHYSSYNWVAEQEQQLATIRSIQAHSSGVERC